MVRPLFHLAAAALVGVAGAASAATTDPSAASAVDRNEVVVHAPFDPIFAAPRVPDRQLASMRGGMRLPNGFDVSIGIDIQTRVDGVLVLHTLYASDGPITGVRVYTDGKDGDRFAPGTVVVTNPGMSGAPVIVTSRSPTGTTVSVTPQVGSSVVNLVNGPEATWVTAEGQTQVPVTVNGGPVTTGPGTFMLTSNAGGTIATLDTGDLQISHLVGQATGAVIANTANDRVIDTVSSVNIDLANVSPLLSSSMFANEALALDLVRSR